MQLSTTGRWAEIVESKISDAIVELLIALASHVAVD
jgi:hypothetical protein